MLFPVTYVSSISGSLTGHWRPFEEALRAIFTRAGHRFSVISAEEFLGSKTLDAGVGAPSLFFRYEGSLGELPFWASKARRNPENTYVLNIFSNEGNLSTYKSLVGAIPRLLDKKKSPRSLRASSKSVPTDSLPNNLILTAETDEKAFFLRAQGFQVSATIPIFSNSLYDSDFGWKNPSLLARKRRLMVLASHHQLSSGAIRWSDVISVALNPLLRRNWSVEISGQSIERFNRTAKLFLGLVGIVFSEGGRSTEEYLAKIQSADLVLFAYSDFYVSQSSGKSLDCLISGVPILARRGTDPHRRAQSILSGYPGYSSKVELGLILLRWSDWETYVLGVLRDSHPNIREKFHPKNLYSLLSKFVGGAPQAVG